MNEQEIKVENGRLIQDICEESLDKESLLKSLTETGGSIGKLGFKQWTGNLCLAIIGLGDDVPKDILSEYLTTMGF